MAVHKHLLLRVEAQKPPKEPKELESWIVNLVNKLGMELYSGPHVKYLEDSGNRGLTGICIIKTSHIAVHVWDEPNPALMQIDAYTCGPLKVNNVVEELQIFEPLKVEYKFLDRELELKEVEACQWRSSK